MTRMAEIAVFAGGLPLWYDGRVVAGIGVSGGTTDQDAVCAAGAAALWPHDASHTDGAAAG